VSTAVPRSAAPAGPTGPAFAVQVAAYDTRGGAQSLAARLRASGLDAFIEGQGAAGEAAPFRVKVGRFSTRSAAAASLTSLRGRGVTGFVTTTRPASASPR
jgi:cell division septation protein DedD